MLDYRYRPDPRKAFRTVGHPQLREHLPALQSFMVKSRELRNDPEQLLYLQAEMANFVLGAQESQHRLADEVADAVSRGHPEAEDVEAVLLVAQRMAYLVRQVADGIAWRSLGYDRAMLHQLALKPPTGHLDLNTVLSEMTVAAGIVAETGANVVLNDLTNFLRYGDLTAIAQDGITIHEVKAGEGAARSGHAKRQRKRTQSVIDFLSAGEREGPEGIEKVVRFSSAPKGHARELVRPAADARKGGSASARLSDCLAAEVFHVELMAEALDRDDIDVSKAFHNPFSQSTLGATHHSLFWDRFTPNVAPYSVFPVPVVDCVDIMTGQLWVWTYFNLGNLIRCIRRRDLLVSLPTDEELAQAPKNLRPGEIKHHELDNPILVTRGSPGPVLAVSFAALSRMMHELLDEESFADMMEESLDLAVEDQEALLFSAFEREAVLWD